MSGKKFYQKVIKDASKFRRMEIEVLLARMVETFEYDDGLGKPDVNINELNGVLRVAHSLPHVGTQPLTPKELSWVFRLYICLQKDGRAQLVNAVAFCETILINAGYNLNFEPLEKIKLEHVLNIIIPRFIPDVESEEKNSIVGDLLSLLGDPTINVCHQAESLILLTRLLEASHCGVTTETVTMGLNQLLKWIRATEVTQASQHQFFGDRETDRKSSKMITELDGGQCQERFTVLNTGKYFTQSQYIHLEIFTLLKTWVKKLLDLSKESPESALVSKVLVAAKDEIAAYVKRLLHQCERQTKTPAHRELVMCSLLEAVDLVKIVCDVDHSFVPQFYLQCSNLFQKCQLGELPPVLAVKLLKVLVQYADGMGKDPMLYIYSVFAELLSRKYTNSDFVHELIHYIIDNADNLCLKSAVTVKYFPNICKIFVWNPRSYIQQFRQIFPMFIDESSILETLHYILDLPCVAATMELCRQVSRNEDLGTLRPLWEDPLNQSYIKFLMRFESGKGDTLSKMDRIFSVLEMYSQHTRVVYNYDVSLRLLRDYFALVLSGDISEECTRDLVPLVLERCALLYGPPLYKREVNQLLSGALITVLELYPTLLFDFYEDVRDFVSHSRHLYICYDVYAGLLYAIGNSGFTAVDIQERTDKLAKLYEALECVTYEVLAIPVRSSEGTLPASFWGLVAVCLAKVTAVVQDLIPRCTLVMSKIRQVHADSLDTETGAGLLPRITELTQFLQKSNIGPSLLASDRLETAEPHSNPHSLAAIMREVGWIVQQLQKDRPSTQANVDVNAGEI